MNCVSGFKYSESIFTVASLLLITIKSLPITKINDKMNRIELIYNWQYNYSPCAESLAFGFLRLVHPCRQHRGDWRSLSAQIINDTFIKEPAARCVTPLSCHDNVVISEINYILLSSHKSHNQKRNLPSPTTFYHKFVYRKNTSEYIKKPYVWESYVTPSRVYNDEHDLCSNFLSMKYEW